MMKTKDKSTHKAPGRSDREGITVIELFKMFPDEESARKWFEDIRWEKERHCGHCGSVKTKEVKSEKPMPYWCSDCRSYFSVRTGTPMQSSKISLQKWVIGIYLMSVNLKGVSSMKLHRELGIAQSCAWHLSQRIREGWVTDDKVGFSGVVEVDETYVGGLSKNKHNSQKTKGTQGRSTKDKAVVVGVKDRGTKKVKAKSLNRASSKELHGFINENVEKGSVVYTDDAKMYNGMVDFEHSSINHSIGSYVEGMVHTQGIESFWSMLKRGYNGTYHKMSKKHLDRYVTEFAGRHNVRDLDTLQQMAMIVKTMDGRVLPYKKLIQ